MVGFSFELVLSVAKDHRRPMSAVGCDTIIAVAIYRSHYRYSLCVADYLGRA
jgi:hypothetical protein